MVLGGLKSGVGDLAVVNDDGVTLGATLLIGPANALGELSLRVGKEELENQNISQIQYSEIALFSKVNIRCRHQ